MPWQISKTAGGFVVKNKSSGKAMSNEPHATRADALAQMKALYANGANESRFTEGNFSRPLGHTRVVIGLLCAILSFCARATTLVWPPNTQTDVVSAVPFYAGEGVTRYQQWIDGSALGGTNLHLTNISFSLTGTNTLQFTNFVLTLSATTNAPSLLMASNYGPTQVLLYSNSAYSVALTTNKWNLSFPVTNAFAFNATNQNLLIDLQIGQTNGSAPVVLSSAVASGSNVFRLFSIGGATNALYLDPECIPTQLQWTNP